MAERSHPNRHGIDVSDFQGQIDWEMAAWHVSMAYVQVGESTGQGSYECRTARQNLSGARAAGLAVGAYYYCYPTTDGAPFQGAHASHTARVAGWDPERDLPLAFDFEINPAAMAVNAMSDWIDACLGATGIDPKHLAVYTNPAFWETNTDGRAVNAHLWVAAWGAPKPPRLTGLPEPFCWQTSDRGHIPGIDGLVDLDTLLFVPDAPPARVPENVQETPAGPVLRPPGDP